MPALPQWRTRRAFPILSRIPLGRLFGYSHGALRGNSCLRPRQIGTVRPAWTGHVDEQWERRNDPAPTRSRCLFPYDWTGRRALPDHQTDGRPLDQGRRPGRAPLWWPGPDLPEGSRHVRETSSVFVTCHVRTCHPVSSTKDVLGKHNEVIEPGWFVYVFPKYHKCPYLSSQVRSCHVMILRKASQ